MKTFPDIPHLYFGTGGILVVAISPGSFAYHPIPGPKDATLLEADAEDPLLEKLFERVEE